ncbi:MAG: hypothetical protein ACJAZF_005078 [Granulosicoccus sp.]|jgi:hypothetical protein
MCCGETHASSLQDITARRLLPIQWGLFQLVFRTWYDPVLTLNELEEADGIKCNFPLLTKPLSLMIR